MGWVFDGGGGLGFLMLVVGWVFLFGRGGIHTVKDRKKEKGRDVENKKEL